MSPLTVGIIGCGKQAPKHLRGFQADRDVEIVLGDIDEARARALAESEGVRWAPVDEILADPSIAAVDLCTPTTTHAGLIEQAVLSGKAFLCEKPLCQTLAEAERIGRAVLAHEAIGMVGFVYRLVPAFEVGAEVMKGVAETGTSAVLGRVVSATFRIGGRGSHRLWKHRRETGGGAINEMLVHMLDLALWYFGDAREVVVHRRELLQPQRVIDGVEYAVDAEDYVVVSVRTEGGVEVLIQADLITPAFSQSVEVQGANGTFRGSITADALSFVHTLKAVEGWPAGRNLIDTTQTDFFQAEVRTFLEAVREGRAPVLGNVLDAVRLMRVVEEIRTAPVR